MSILEIQQLFTATDQAVTEAHRIYKHQYDKGIHVIRVLKDSGYRVIKKRRYRTTDHITE